MTRLSIQGRAVDAKDGETLLEVARRHGFEIPSLCHHRALEPYGACRICLVEVSKKGRAGHLAAACTHPALQDLEVSLDTPQVTRARRIALELLLAHAPRAPQIVAIARRYGVETSRFERVEEPLDCILCGLCERVCRDVVGACAISLAGRGNRRRIEAPFGRDELCIGCGACEAVCPTGVLHQMREDALERYRELPGEDRQCRYSLMGLIPGALCANDFRCERCETEQAMVDAASEHPVLQAVLEGRREVQK